MNLTMLELQRGPSTNRYHIMSAGLEASNESNRLPEAGQWIIMRNGERGAAYLTAEVAFEVAAAQASIEMRSDHDIVIHVRQPDK
jgi:hypothetical protein